MAHLLGAEHISLSYPTKDVFDDLSLGLAEGQRIGIVGRNGDGKTTLLRLLAGEMQPDTGRVTRRGGITVGVLAQTPDLDPDETVGHAVVGDLPEHEWASQPRVRDVLQGLLGDLDWHATTGALSGGQRRRVALAALLRQDWDVLFLDEPTNHLDVEGITWLARHLKQRWPKNAGGLVMVTHDRWFLDAVCTDTWEVHDGTVEPFEGGYAAYILQRVERDRQAAAVEAKRQNLMRKELAWLGRGAPARSSKPKFRIEAANELIADVPPVRDRVRLQSMATSRLGKDVIDVLGVTVQYDEHVLMHDVEWRIGPGDRLGLLGANGAGKSTLLSLIKEASAKAGSTQAAQLDAGDGTAVTAGRIKVGKTVKLTELTQELHELDAVNDDRVREVIGRVRTTYKVGDEDLSPSQMLERLGFSSVQLSTPVRDLSGGQRRRLQLLLTLLDEPNVLVLDEPTNDLDTDMLAAMEDVLDAWPGTLIVVSHDRYFLERVTDDQYALIGGTLRHLPGGVDEFLRLDAAAHEGSSADADKTPSSSRAASGAGHAAGAASGAGASGASAAGLSGAERRAAEKRLQALERKLAKARDALTKVDADLAAADQSDFEGLSKIDALRRSTSGEIDELEAEWLDLAEQLEG
ncbi:ABC-F family ATP-binding cassette domain-containing protein [Pseudoclavibacter sp. CFCC 13611]|uniref:ABC-F family ATP-binding cassette domain-containing protein n=1 Tax=Pseudoclavibacter sp. CFCC 13611 TaxID=2615178 RepID=UPI001301508C|nr:ABC-F family ATP-binding cassette domain-containing protein [Pseudoclavibacter sp. CFCC 13611]KAB1662652.1 ABC-F family ATP-binding cassette domain-containing protein [Pseudoclavibacter sp. CFCC 13611]